MAEMEGFEPPHALRRLADFESAPFSHLGTSPKTWLLYQRYLKKSRLFLGVRLLFCQFQNHLHLSADGFILLPAMGPQTGAAILDSVFGILKLAAALIPQGIQWAIAKNTAEGFRICTFMAGKIFTLLMLKKIIMGHDNCHTFIFSFPTYCAILMQR